MIFSRPEQSANKIIILMHRRRFIHQSFLVSAAWTTGLNIPLPSTRTDTWERVAATVETAPSIQLPLDKRIPLGWPAFPVSHQAELTVLKFSKPTLRSSNVWLRLTAAIDFREEKKIDVLIPRTGEKIGQFNIRYAHPFQPFQISLTKKDLRRIKKDGLALRQVDGEKDAWFFSPNTDRSDNTGLQPHLLVGSSENPQAAYKKNMYDMHAFSPFGWMGGCVLDALWEMAQKNDEAAEENLSKHLDYFLDNEYGIRYENPKTEPMDGRFNSIEDFLPFAVIAQNNPGHKSVQRALDFLLAHEEADGLIVSGPQISTEGCYTVAYPLAVLAVERNDVDLAKKAIKQISLRARYLMNDDGIHQRGARDGSVGFKNWGRGIAWLMLGTAKVIRTLNKGGYQHLPALIELTYILQRSASLIMPFQSAEGLWKSFVDRPHTAIDTSASAGIAAALAWGYQSGVLDEAFKEKARTTHANLPMFLTPDGFLTQVSQINRGGEALQESDFRVISQFGMGLMAQLDCALQPHAQSIF